MTTPNPETLAEELWKALARYQGGDKTWLQVGKQDFTRAALSILAPRLKALEDALRGLLACAGRRRQDGHYEFCLVPNRDVEAAKDAIAQPQVKP